MFQLATFERRRPLPTLNIYSFDYWGRSFMLVLMRQNLKHIVTVAVVGALAGAAFSLSFNNLLGFVLYHLVGEGAILIVAILLLAAHVYLIMLITLLIISIVAYVALRLLRVPRALQVSIISTALLGIAGVLMIRYSAIGNDDQLWVSTICFAATYSLSYIILTARRLFAFPFSHVQQRNENNSNGR